MNTNVAEVENKIPVFSGLIKKTVVQLEMFVFLLSLDFFAESKSYTVLETLRYLASFEICVQIFAQFCTIYRPDQNDVIKLFSFICCRFRLCRTSIFYTLISAYKSYRLTKFYHDDVIFVYFTDQNLFSDFSLQNPLL